MIRFDVTSTLPAACQQAVSDLDAKKAALLNELGTKLLSLQKLDYEAKGTGGPGVDGTTWKPLAPETEVRKFYRGKKRKRDIAQRELDLRHARRETRRIRKANLSPSQREDRYAALIAKMGIPKSQIGVDTGLQRNSATPGYSSPGGGNIFTIEGNSVTVGYGRFYSEYFDDVRPILPSEPLPGSWTAALDAIVRDWIDDILKPLSR